MGNAPSPMRRMTRPVVAPQVLTPARALRLAMVRAAKDAVSLPLTVPDIREEEGSLDDLLSRLEDGLLILSLREGGEPAGLIGLDFEACSAAIEAQALGHVSDVSAEPRLPTSADVALARPLLSAFLREAGGAVADSPFADWLKGPRLGDRLPGGREAAVLLPDGSYRAVRLTLDLGAGGRQGLLLLMLRLPPPQADEPKTAGTTLAPQVMAATLPVDAVLHRMRLPLSEAEALEAGQVLPLPGVTVNSLRLEAAGLALGAARLGQVAGMRAVRMELPLAPQLGGLRSLGGLGEPEAGGAALALLPEP